MSSIKIPRASEKKAAGENIDILFWVGCAGSFDDRAKKITIAFSKILDSCGINYAILGQEESCTGDPARRAGNEFVFQMMAASNIQVLNSYDIKKVVTTCPHCFNTLKNEYPELGGNYEVIHHTQFIRQLISEGRIKMTEGGSFKGKRITYHDSCYLGRANGIYEAPREILKSLDADLVEMKRCGTKGLCCGAGGAQMFKEEEKGEIRINMERTKDIKESKAEIVAANCPFCMTMLSDGVKSEEMGVKVYDIAEIIAENSLQ